MPDESNSLTESPDRLRLVRPSAMATGSVALGVAGLWARGAWPVGTQDDVH
jgi:hypothetical protein